jgi:hypothetical protein
MFAAGLHERYHIVKFRNEVGVRCANDILEEIFGGEIRPHVLDCADTRHLREAGCPDELEPRSTKKMNHLGRY